MASCVVAALGWPVSVHHNGAAPTSVYHPYKDRCSDKILLLRWIIYLQLHVKSIINILGATEASLKIFCPKIFSACLWVNVPIPTILSPSLHLRPFPGYLQFFVTEFNSHSITDVVFRWRTVGVPVGCTVSYHGLWHTPALTGTVISHRCLLLAANNHLKFPANNRYGTGLILPAMRKGRFVYIIKFYV